MSANLSSRTESSKALGAPVGLTAMGTTNCFKYTLANPCGHVGVQVFVHYSGGYNDDAATNEVCYRSSTSHDHRCHTKICTVMDFCSREFQATATGWYCCTCSYRKV